jgi:hypothetical protein
MAETATDGFQIVAHNIVVQTRKSISNPDKRIPVSADVAKLSDGTFMSRKTVTGESGLPTHSYDLFDPDRKQIVGGFTPAIDHGADFIRKRDHLSRKHGLHTLPHQPPLGEVDRLLAQFPDFGAKLGLTPTTAPVFVFNPGKAQFPKAGLLDARTWFDRHVQGDFGAHGQYDPTSLEPQALWLAGLPNTPVAMRNRAAIQQGYGLIVSEYPDSQMGKYVHALTLLAGDRAETLIYTDFQFGQ